MKLIRFPMQVRAAFTAGFCLLSGLTVVRAESTAELLKMGDAYDLKLQPRQALNYYEAAEKGEPNNVRILVRIARQYRHLMQDAASNAEKLKFGSMSLNYGRRAATIAPNDSEAQLSPAISYGKMLPLLGSKEQMEASRNIRDAADRAIKLDPKNDLAWHIKGRWNLAMSEISSFKRTLAAIFYEKLPESSPEEAARCFAKAIAINPGRLMNYIELGRAYAKEGRKEEACKAIEKGLSMPAVEKDDPDFKSHGREILATLR